VPKENIDVPDIPKPLAHYTPAVRTGGLVFAAGQLASDFRHGVAPEARVDPAFPYYGSEIKKQTRYALENLARTFRAAGTSLDHVLKAQVFHTDLMNFHGFDEVWKEFFPTPPPRTTVGTTGLLVPGTLVEIDLIAALPSAKPEAVSVPDIPRPLAHYTPAVRTGGLVFAAGQLASDFRHGVAPEARVDAAFPYYGSDIKKQTRYVLENLARTFKAAGTSLGNVVKAQVFLTDLKHFNAFDEVWKEFFPAPPPRTTVGTTGLLVPGTLVEIDLIAARPSAKPEAVSVPDIPRPLAHYTPAVRVGDLVFTAGHLASDFKTGIPAEARRDPAFPLYGSDVKKQARYILENYARTFKAAGTSLANVVKAQVFMMNLDDFDAFDEVWKEFFPAPPPRTTVGTTGLLVPGALLEVDLIAAMP
jgi:enamine deaminase RidA (YjgF/YER057c/UK114 family)